MASVKNLDFAIILGADLTEEFPVIWLRLHQAIHKGAKVFFLGHYAPEFSQNIEKTILHAPGEELEAIREHLPEIMANAGKERHFCGPPVFSNSQRVAIVDELLKLKASHVTLNFLEGKGNSFGAQFAGMHPKLIPEGIPAKNPGMDFDELIDEIAKSGWDYLHIAGADVFSKASHRYMAKGALKLKIFGCSRYFPYKNSKRG